ncbi:MAG: RagB/SusD family nutrient uptake outer membrane protein [Prevotella sp.]
MKKISNNIRLIGAAALGVLIMGSCSDILDEQPRSNYDPGFFQTELGIKGGLTSLYANLRNLYGQAYYFNSQETGTDEYTYAQSADGNFKDADVSGAGSPLNSTNCRADVLWGSAFSNINTASGVIENATAAGMSEALIAEARFFRAFDYFNLVQTFGGVPLDLGSGELKFNTSTSRTSVRNTVPEVYTKAVFPDLLTAINDLPEKPRLTGALTKNVARLILAKAYLTYGWWLENPNGIPTYPECSRTDPDGHDAKWYYQQAYDIALDAIKNPGAYSLQPTFYDVNVATNDRNSECMLYADHNDQSELYNGGSFSYGSGGAPDNFVSWMGCWNYTTMTAEGNTSGVINPVQRECVQALGRPWTRMATPQEVFTKVFTDVEKDSRLDGTFTTTFYTNWKKGGKSDDYVEGANGSKIYYGEPFLKFVLSGDPAITYPNGGGKNNVGAGEMAGENAYVVGVTGISRLKYPMLWKQGPYRTDNGSGLGQPNAGSTRPYVVCKFSELYLVAAEAAVKGASTQGGYSARELVNVLRARAGKWRWNNNGNCEKVADYSKELTDATPATITIDYILDERMREFFGETMRWFDLARTQTWEKRAGQYTICGSGAGDHTPQVFTRTITKDMYLRPIPQGQIDGLEMTDAEKDAYQNPGYRN